MRLNILTRRLHRWGAVAIGLPIVLVISTGLLLQVKKQVPWVQPAEQRTDAIEPAVPWGYVLAAARGIPEAGVESWADIERVDVRPSKGILKVVTTSRWELQLRIDDGTVLQTEYRRSDLIESLHDGSFFGDGVKLWIFLPVGVILFGLWLTGLWLWVLPYTVKWKRAALAKEAATGTAAVISLIVAAALGVLSASAWPGDALGAQARSRAQTPYVPGAVWERRSPAAMGVDSARLAEAIAFAVTNEARAPRDMEESHYRSFGREPFGQGIGPFKPRGEPSGVILRGGFVIASWGEPDRVDMTHSVTKSLLSSVVGVAVDRGLISSIDEPVWRSQAPIYLLRTEAPAQPGERYGTPTFYDPFATPHNRTITWDHLLRQTSDWEGTLWGKPEWADRPAQDASTWTTRARRAPGTSYEYNDVRVNILALAATNVWRRPLPEVLDELVMTPIGASRTWRWFGYDNAWITLDGRAVQVPSGGGHWGGGVFINAWDMARFGLLTQRRGVWGERRILSESWVQQALTPTGPQPTYGYMNWFLNTDRKWMPSAPASAFGHVGNGTNLVFVAPEQDLVIVVRWIENRAVDEFLGKALGAIVR
jgi:CubicO group peptidase (beta-lactamase class C family)